MPTFDRRRPASKRTALSVYWSCRLIIAARLRLGMDDSRRPEHISAGKITPADEVRGDRLPVVDVFANDELMKVGERRRRTQKSLRAPGLRDDVERLGAHGLAGQYVPGLGNSRLGLELPAKGLMEVGGIDLEKVDEFLRHIGILRRLGQAPRKPEGGERGLLHDAHCLFCRIVIRDGN